MSGSDPVKSFDTLDVQVKALEGDVRDIKTSITSLGAEVRQALTNVTAQFALQQRTPWGVLISGAMAVIAVLGIFGSQALSPMQADIKGLKDNLFPREEAIFRYGINNQRLGQVESDVRQIQARRYDELIKRIDQLDADRIQRNK